MRRDKNCDRKWRETAGEKYLALWHALKGWRLFAFYMLHYTVLFALLSLYIFRYTGMSNKNFIWAADGISQHFPRLLYISRTLRDGIKALLAGEGWTIPLYDFRTGLVTQDLQIVFPQILAAFIPTDRIDLFYKWYVMGIYYFTGLSFSVLGFYFHQMVVPILTGAMSYAFCSYSLFATVRHPHFGVPMIILPLLIVGIEKVLQKRNAWLLTFTVFLSLTTQWGLYFSCMQAVLTGIYVIVRFFDVYRKKRFREFLRLCWRLAVWGGTGILLAGAVALPSLITISKTGRIGAGLWKYSNMFHYPRGYYARFLMNFAVTPNSPGWWTIPGFSVLTLLAVPLLFFRKRRRERSLRIIFLILTLMLMVPGIAYIMSGFSNISNRFCFGYALCVSSILMFMVPRFAALNRRTAAVLSLSMLAYFTVCYFAIGNKIYQEAAMVLLFVTVLSLACCYGLRKRRVWIMSVCLTVTCFSVCYTAFSLYAPGRGNYVREFKIDAYETIGRSQYSVLKRCETLLEDGSFYRVSGNRVPHTHAGFSFFLGLNGLTMFPYFGWSSSYMNWVSEMETARTGNKHILLGLDNRAALLTLAGVKYSAYERPTTAVPYDFFELDHIKNGGNESVVLKNNHWLPLGYTYENYLSRSEYEKLDALGKQEAQIQTAVLEDSPLQISIKEKNPLTTARKIPYKIKTMKDLTWKNGQIVVEKEKASMTLEFSGMLQTETYLRVVNLDLTDGPKELSWRLKAAAGTVSAEAVFYADANVYSHGQKTQLLNMGYFPSGCSSLTITFPHKGTCKLEDLEILCQPMHNYAAQIAALREEVLENIRTNWRGLTGNITVSKDKILCIAIPWLDGWKAYVDGKEVKLHRANTAFMAVELPAGAHEIELRYWLPGLTIGLIMSGCGVLCLIALFICFRKHDDLSQ